MNIYENKYHSSAPNHNDGGQYSYSDSDYVTEGPEDRKVNSRRSQHSSPMPMYQQPYQRECEFQSLYLTVACPINQLKTLFKSPNEANCHYV